MTISPFDYPVGPCPICGEPADDCACPECPVCVNEEYEIFCGKVACLFHLPTDKLASLIETLKQRLIPLEKEAKKREHTTTPCPTCGKEYTITIFQDFEAYCCGRYYGPEGVWFREGED